MGQPPCGPVLVRQALFAALTDAEFCWLRVAVPDSAVLRCPQRVRYPDSSTPTCVTHCHDKFSSAGLQYKRAARRLLICLSVHFATRPCVRPVESPYRLLRIHVRRRSQINMTTVTYFIACYEQSNVFSWYTVEDSPIP